MLLLTVLASWCVLAALLAPFVGRMIGHEPREPRRLPGQAHDRCYTHVVPVPRAPRRAAGERPHATASVS